MRRQRFVAAGKVMLIAVVVVMLSGCFGFLKVGLTIAVEPDPITFTFDELTEEKEITVNFTTKGIGNLTLDKAILELFEPEEAEDPVWDEEHELDTSTLIIPGITVPNTFSLELPSDLQYTDEEEYNQELKGRAYTLKITVTGSIDAIISEVEVKFE